MGSGSGGHDEGNIGRVIPVMTYYIYALLIFFGHVRDFVGVLLGVSRYIQSVPKPGYSVLLKSWESFFTRRIFHRIQDCWNRPICSSPGARINVMERVTENNNYNLEVTGKFKTCINTGSYNYLGYADDWKETCREDVLDAVDRWPASMCSSRMDFGTTSLLTELETLVAAYVGKEAAIVLPMGYNTNVTCLSMLMREGTLIISDNLNHTSIVNGSRASEAQIRVFRSNDIAHLEEVLQEAVMKGQPRGQGAKKEEAPVHRPWKKIMVVVEGIYSMEGAVCRLREIVPVCKKYKAYLYVDEAHSIGALGATGRGVCEYTNTDPADVNVLMGTFTKSFSGMGGYVAADRATIEYLRACNEGMLYHNAMSPVVTQQVITAFKVIMGTIHPGVGKKKIVALRENSNYFRSELKKMGLHVFGDEDSPIIPVMIYMPSKLAAFSRECLKRGLAVVVVGFPATPLILARARFCISAGHSRKDLDEALAIVKEVSELMLMNYEKNPFGLNL